MPSGDELTNTMGLADAELIARVDDRLRRFIEQAEAPGPLKEAVTYALFGGGKRIRPVLCMRACEAVGGMAGGMTEDAVVAAGAVELIHCFSLVHDDLPAMDDDDLRRGRPTLHKHTSEAMAILAGDAMTALAFQYLAQAYGDRPLSATLVRVLASATSAMIAGQVLDTMGGFEEHEGDLARLGRVHEHKTGALLGAAVEMGGRCGGADAGQLDALRGYAQAVGLMFQAVDDLLDVTQPTEVVGKQTGKDAAAGKLTYPGLLGVDGTRAEIAALLQRALAAIQPLGPPAEPLRDLARALATREK